MVHFLLQLPPAGLPQQTSTVPELPPGPSLDRVRGPIEIPLLEPWQITLCVIFGLFVTFLIGRWGLNYFRTRKNRVLPTLPHSAAIAELNIASELASEDDQRFAVLCSLALRRYFETGKGIDALGKTTDEFLKGLKTNNLLNPDAYKLLADFLSHCDRVKFAGESLSEADRRTLVENAIALIQSCEQISDVTATSSV